MSATLAGKLNGVADSIGNATGSMTVGNTVSNVLAGLSGALVGGSADAFTASNADLYNRDTSNANGTGGTGSQALDKALQYAKDFGQAALDLVPGHKMADQAQTAFANGNYGMGAALAVGSIADAAIGLLTAGESKLVSSTVDAGVQSSSSAIRKSVLSNIADSQAANASSNFSKFSATEGQLQETLGIWPPNSGGYSPVYSTTLDVGTQIDRYGYPGGKFVSPVGVPFESCALPASYADTKPYFQYEVIQPITGVTQAKILPWFGSPGAGIQYQLENSVQWYIDNKYLVKK